MLEYSKNRRLFWATVAALVVVVLVLWHTTPKCSEFGGQAWDAQTNTPIDCR